MPGFFLPNCGGCDAHIVLKRVNSRRYRCSTAPPRFLAGLVTTALADPVERTASRVPDARRGLGNQRRVGLVLRPASAKVSPNPVPACGFGSPGGVSTRAFRRECLIGMECAHVSNMESTQAQRPATPLQGCARVPLPGWLTRGVQPRPSRESLGSETPTVAMHSCRRSSSGGCLVAATSIALVLGTGVRYSR